MVRGYFIWYRLSPRDAWQAAWPSLFLDSLLSFVFYFK